MARLRRRFGPLSGVTALVFLIAVISLPFWPWAQEQWTAWTLSRRLRDPAEPVRRDAAERLAQLGPAATSWVIGAMRDQSTTVRRLACSILPRTVPENAHRAVAALITITSAADADATVRATAVEQLAIFLTGGPLRAGATSRESALQAITAALEDKAAAVREAAGLALWNLGLLAKSAASDLDRALDSPDRKLRVLAAMALLRIKPDDAKPRITAAMTSLLVDHSDPFNHWRAVHTLKSAIGQEALLTRLVSSLNSQDASTRRGATADLINHCGDAKGLAHCLWEAMASADGTIRCEAALFLADRPELLKMVDEEELAISASAMETLTKIDPPTAAAVKRGIETGALRSRDD